MLKWAVVIRISREAVIGPLESAGRRSPSLLESVSRCSLRILPFVGDCPEEGYLEQSREKVNADEQRTDIVRASMSQGQGGKDGEAARRTEVMKVLCSGRGELGAGYGTREEEGQGHRHGQGSGVHHRSCGETDTTHTLVRGSAVPLAEDLGLSSDHFPSLEARRR